MWDGVVLHAFIKYIGMQCGAGQGGAVRYNGLAMVLLRMISHKQQLVLLSLTRTDWCIET